MSKAFYHGKLSQLNTQVIALLYWQAILDATKPMYQLDAVDFGRN